MAAMALINQFPCANTEHVEDGEISPCPKTASLVCGACSLVQYCSKQCQVQHWSLHKLDCKSPLMKTTWKPQWETENRTPAFVNGPAGGPPLTSHGLKKYLWGNVPALDILRCKQNEADGLPGDLSLLFAASGDLRNVVSTLAELPTTFNGNCSVMINDRDFDIVARNVILLLTALHFGREDAVPKILHLWYSALITEEIYRALRDNILPLIQEVCSKIREKPLASLQAKTWKYGTRSVRLVLQKQQWDRLPAYLEVPSGLSAAQAHEIRLATMLAPERRDYIDRAMFTRPPAMRVCMTKFRQDGILLPFGSPRIKFNTPNPTFYQTKDSWPMKDSAEPLEGWPMEKVILSTPPAKKDVYGCLYLHIQDVLLRFLQRIEGLTVSFQLFCVDAMDLPDILHNCGVGEHSFDRIEVSNIADSGYLGPVKTLGTFSALLKQPSQNPHATLITLFLNAVEEVSTRADSVTNMVQEMDRLKRYLPLDMQLLQRHNHMHNAEFLAFSCAKILVRDFDTLFQRYVDKWKLKYLGNMVGMEMKEENTVVDKWPLRLRENATQEQFDLLHASGHQGMERYVEWRFVR
ncbi:hypothetical protein LOCC1_G004360 [Lachnellula occidentalis]|uniref:MYND-type domain-containing protein n=1 Tax=Lachnellula occidentalis TaxID=215460 RepID=A0A8H8RY31_9HELO|nr:hypothetical protein LOCC1_G004360 [Lachnellula occidentalis]